MKNFLLLYIFFAPCVFAFSQSDTDSSTYFFKTTFEGIYKLKNPFHSPDSVLILNNSTTYIPYYDKAEDFFYIYAENKSVYQLTKSIYPLQVKLSITAEINNQKFYKYSLYTISGNWLHQEVNADEVYKETIHLGKLINNSMRDTIKLFLYNFSTESANIDITLNGEKHTIPVLGQAEQSIILNYPVTDGTLELQAFSKYSSFAIIKYQYDPFNRIINDHAYFQKLIVSNSYKIARDDDTTFSYYTFFREKLQRVYLEEGKQTFTNLLIQRTKSITTLSITKAKGVDFESADYLILTTQELMNEANTLVALIKKKSPFYRFKLIDVQTIYNSFSKSELSADAIKEYLHLMQPKYVLFIGDSNEKDGSINNTIPTFYFNQLTQNCRIVTDYKYTYKTDCTNPIFALGRIPVTTVSELHQYIEKVRLFTVGSNREKILFLDDDHILSKENLKKTANLYNENNHNFFYHLFYNDFIDEVNLQKSNILIHIGHGSFTGWRKKGKIDIDQFNDLKKERLFNVVDLSCWTGDFSNSNNDGFSEQLLKIPYKGAVNVMSFSGFSSMSSYFPIQKYIIENMDTLDLGTLVNKLRIDLLRKGQLSYDDANSFNLLGIPSLYLNPSKIIFKQADKK